jgi:hypothetical protein
MAGRWYSEFDQRKVGASGSSPAPKAGPDNKPKITETEVNWPGPPGAAPGVGFNRKTKWPVVKTRARKAGVD